VSCFQSGLELVDEVQRQRDGISLVRRRRRGSKSASSTVWLVAARAVVPTQLSAADHVGPQCVIGCESESRQSVLEVFPSGATIIERSVCAFGVITTDVKLPLLVRLERGITGDRIGPRITSRICYGRRAGAAEPIIKRGSHGQSFNRGLQAATRVQAGGVL